MTRITIDGEELDLPKGFSITIEETSPIWNDMGSQSVTASVPATPKNRRLMGFPDRLDAAIGPADLSPRCMVQSGAYIRSGRLNITGANAKTIDFNIGFDNSEAYQEWKSKRLAELKGLPSRTFATMTEAKNFIEGIYTSAKPQESDLAVFPVCLSKTTAKEGESDRETIYYEIVNDMADNPFRENRTVMRVIDNTPTEVSVPQGYGCTPFLRAWRIVELIFADLGLTPDRNPFKEDLDLSRLVVMNNTADTLCALTLKYKELMPDVTVEEMLNVLWVRFGLVYHTDFGSGTARLRLMRDLIKEAPDGELEAMLTEPPATEYTERKYLKLSAGTSIEGAEPLTDRLEDFLKGYELGDMAITDYRNGDYWIHGGGSETGIRFIWTEKTGMWRRDSFSGRKGSMAESSSFFKWDPSTPGMAAEELVSPDEQTPVGTINGSLTLPMMLTGSRHFHTAIDGGGEDEESDCPICLMFAFTGHSSAPQGTIGRLGPDHTHYGTNGSNQFTDGSDHTTTLYFQFSDGLFAKFWSGYDELLRHSGRNITATLRMDTIAAIKTDMMRKTRIKGTPVFPDTMTMTLGQGKGMTVEATFRSAVTQGGYDIEREQNVPHFPPDWNDVSFETEWD